MAKKYDYLIVGAGLYGAVFAREVMDRGKSCLVIDRRPHIGGNVWCDETEGINVHKYGPHIFHTSNERVWKYVNRFAEFNNFILSPLAKYRGKLYNLPFNMNTFYQMWGVQTPDEAKAVISKQISHLNLSQPQNLEEQALSMVGSDIYEKLIKGYTEKQWGRQCVDLPSFIIKRLPLRFTFNNNYFNDRWQGIPIGGYNKMVAKMLEGAEVWLNTDYYELTASEPCVANRTVFTGQIDEFFKYKYGALEYRSVRFETETLDIDNYQGNAIVNYTESEIPYTRIIEHKHFEFGTGPKTVISREYPSEWNPSMEPFYPINDDKNMKLYNQYRKLADAINESGEEGSIIFGGRLGSYKYYDMDKVIEAALNAADKEVF